MYLYVCAFVYVVFHLLQNAKSIFLAFVYKNGTTSIKQEKSAEKNCGTKYAEAKAEIFVN